ncbi:MAG TPA: ABC transporter permease [Mycobacteriales bacterium]|nr:ABC transporter permease [Mycobacteriales bacterium]
MRRFDLQRIALGLAAPVLALIVALLLSSIALQISGNPPLHAFKSMLDYGTDSGTIVQTLNKSTTYYLSALAVAIGFRMNLFNIGVDGQYQIAAFAAAVVGGWLITPGPITMIIVVLVAIVVGAFWAGIAAVLKATRGVSEVISTIMLNVIGGGIVAYLLDPKRLGTIIGSQQVSTRPMKADAYLPGIPLPGGDVYGFVVVAALAGLGYWVLLGRTRFGFDLRATGLSETAAVASGVQVKRMVVRTMLLSGAVAGLVGMPLLLGGSHAYASDFPTGYGFSGIAIALLGRNHPIGIAIGALLWSFLEQSAQILDLEGVPKEIVTIMQGVTVLSVVVAYELVRRFSLVQEQRRVGAELRAAAAAGEGSPA